MKILLDLGGNCFGGKELTTFSNNLNANTYLQDFQNEFTTYLENRILVQQLINRIGGGVASIPWYNSMDETIFMNSLENQVFIGSVKDRLKHALEYNLTFWLRLSILPVEESCIFVGVNSKDKEVGIKVAEQLQVLSDANIEVPKIKVVFPNLETDNYVERTLYRELSAGKHKDITFVDVILGVKDNSSFLDDLTLGIEALVHFVSNSINEMKEVENV